MTELDDTNVVLHLFSPEVAADPHPVYRQMLDQCPVAHGDFGGTQGVLLSRYEDVLWSLLLSPEMLWLP